jgi:GNAT superfamily N-acetyltransferase
MLVRPLEAADRDTWETLWKQYLDFYKTTLPPEQIELTWERLQDGNEPMRVLGAFDGTQMLGIVHYIFHRSCWTAGPYCYLQDLFTVAEARGRGVGRALIDAVYTAAKLEGASRVYWLTHESNAKAMVLYDKIADRSGFLQYRKNL